MFVPMYLTHLTVQDKVTVIMTVKEARSNSPGDGYRVLRLSPISPEASHPPQFPADTGRPPLNFTVDYPSVLRRRAAPL